MGYKALGLFTDLAEIEQRLSFADGLEVLQPKIKQAIEDHKNSDVALYEINGLRKPEETDD